MVKRKNLTQKKAIMKDHRDTKRHKTSKIVK